MIRMLDAEFDAHMRTARLHGWLVAKGLKVEGDETLAELEEASKYVAMAEFFNGFMKAA